jgi:phosphatidylglycerophosphate synthase
VRADLACSLSILALATGAGAAYAVRVTRAGAARFARLDKEGNSALLGKGAMSAGYWALQPVGRALIALGVTANQVTLFSLATGVAAAVALALGHFGIGAALTAVATLCDALDGLVARQTGTASDAGEVFDAAVDRYQEMLFLGGLCVYFRTDPFALALALAALLGSFMVSYSTAKAEALRVDPPRGAMRRAERAVYLDAGVVFAPIGAALAARLDLPAWLETLPILLSLGLVGVVGNYSAVRRLHAVARAVAARDGKSSVPALAANLREPPRPPVEAGSEAEASHADASHGVSHADAHDGVTP